MKQTLKPIVTALTLAVSANAYSSGLVDVTESGIYNDTIKMAAKISSFGEDAMGTIQGYLPEVERGDAQSAYLVGRYYIEEAKKLDPVMDKSQIVALQKKAVGFFEKAAAKGHAEATFEAGFFMLDYDVESGYPLVKKAAEMGIPQAEHVASSFAEAFAVFEFGC